MATTHQIFIHSAATSVPAVDDLESYCWLDAEIPNLVGAAAILAEVPPEDEVSAELLREIQFAGEAGAQVVWLITAQSSRSTLEELLATPLFALRKDGQRDTFIVKDSRFVEYFANVSSYHFIFQVPPGFDTVATVSGSTVSLAVVRKASASSYVAFLPLPIPSVGPSVKSLLNALSEIRAAAAARQDPLRALWTGVKACALLVSLVVGLQYYYAHLNRSVNDSIVTPLDSSPHGFILSQLNDIDENTEESRGFRNILSLTPNEVIGRPNLDRILGVFTSLGIESLEGPTVTLLQEQQQRAPAGSVSAADQHLSAYSLALYRSLRFDLMNHQYQTARLHAHQFLSCMYSLHDPNAKAYQALKSRQAHAVINMVKDQYIYHDKNFVHFFIAGDSSTDVDQRPAPPADPSLLDDAYYFHCTSATRDLVWPKEGDCWRGFMASFPHSPRLPDAAYNLVRSHFYGALRVRTTSPGEVTRALRDCDEFVARYPTSYLSDDVQLYALQLASVASDSEDLWTRYLAVARSSGEGRDSFDRLLVRLSNKTLEECSPSAEALQSLLRLSVVQPDRTVRWLAATQLREDQRENLPDLIDMLTTSVDKGSPQNRDLRLKQATIALLKMGLNSWSEEVDQKLLNPDRDEDEGEGED